tara:strand:+ start:1080 stop:1226 length:147 start_codon:yes stop_codon:yes gene_type:complete
MYQASVLGVKKGGYYPPFREYAGTEARQIQNIRENYKVSFAIPSGEFD